MRFGNTEMDGDVVDWKGLEITSDFDSNSHFDFRFNYSPCKFGMDIVEFKRKQSKTRAFQSFINVQLVILISDQFGNLDGS